MSAMTLLRHWLASALAFLLVAYLLPHFHVRDPLTAVVASAVLGLLNALVRPVLTLLTLPLTILTLGLFSLVLNGLMMWVVAVLVPGLRIDGFGTAILAAIGVWLAGWILGAMLRPIIH